MFRATKWTTQDKQRQRREEARNNLEAAVYSIQDNLQKESIIEVSTVEERDKLVTLISAASEWLYGDGDLPTTGTEEFEKKRMELASLYDPMVQRREGFAAIPEAAQKLKKSIADANAFIESITVGRNESEPMLYEESDIDKVVEAIQETSTFLTETDDKIKKALDNPLSN